MNDITTIIIIILLLIIAILLFKLAKKSKSKITFFHSNNPEEFKQKLQEMDFPQEFINSLDEQSSTITKTSHYSKTIYKNGEKISEETKSSNNIILPLTNCPNCDAKIENQATNCRYCNTPLTTYHIKQK